MTGITMRREVKKRMIQIKNNADNAEIIISGDILDDSWRWDLDGFNDYNTYPSSIRDMLKGLENKDVNVRINSLGGDVFAGIAISNILKSHNAKTTAIVDGIAASSASIIAFGCDEIKMPTNAYLMIHKPSCYASGTADDLRKQADVLDNIQTAILDTYKSKAKVEDSEISKMIDAETWLKGSQAKEYFNVEITDAITVKNCASNLQYSNIPKEVKDNIEIEPKEEDTISQLEIERIVKDLQAKVDSMASKNKIEKKENTLTDKQKEMLIESVFFNAKNLKGDEE